MTIYSGQNFTGESLEITSNSPFVGADFNDK